MDKIAKRDLVQAARQIQDILDRKNLELVNWNNCQMENCIWVIQKGSNPWEGARVATAKENKFTKTDNQKFIEKTCEWLKDTLMSDEGGFPITSNGVKEFIKDFKKAMEEE